MKKSGKPSFFKVLESDMTALRSISSEDLGDALKAALDYFSENAPVSSDRQGVRTAFAIFSTRIDEAFTEYRQFVSWGKSGAKKRYETKED